MAFPRPRKSSVFIVSLIFMYQTALAQALPKVAVMPLPGEIGQKASLAVAGALKSTQQVFVVEMPEIQNYLRSQENPQTKTSGIGTAEQKLKQGQEHYLKLKIKDSISTLQEAKILFRQNLKIQSAFEGLRSTQFYLAMAFQANKQDERAKDELRQIYLIDPQRATRKLSEKLYPPSIRSLYEGVKKEYASKPTGDLEVISFPPGALAYVDGKSIGTTPAMIRGIPVGEHFIHVVLENKLDIAASKFVISGDNRFEPDINVNIPQNIYQFFQTVDPVTELDPHRAAFLDSMGVSLGAEVFVFLSPGNQEVKGQLYDQRSQALSSPVSEKSPELLAKKLLRSIGDNGYVVAAPKPTAAVPEAIADAPINLAPKSNSETSDNLIRQARRSSHDDGSWIKHNQKWLYIGGGAVVLGVAAFLLMPYLSGGSSNNSVLKVSIP